MKLVIIFIICTSQTSASFFEDFQGALYSVQDSFGRLLTDVYTDVSQTIGCTILAVKQVLALDQSFHESSDYNRRCRGQEPQSSIEVPRMDKENMAYSYIDNINANHELDNIETEFRSETDRLLAISSLLRREVDNIPKDIKFNFRLVPEPQEPINSIWQSLKILHDVEHNNKNYIRSSEIHKVLDEALNIMNIKTPGGNESDDDKITTIVKDLEKDGSNGQLIEAEKQLEEWKEEEFKELKAKTIDGMNINTSDQNKSDVNKISSDLERDANDVLAKAGEKFEEWKEQQLKSVEIEGINKINKTNANESNVDKIKTLVTNLETDTKDVLAKADEQFKEWKEEESKIVKENDLNKLIETSADANESNVDKIKTIVKTLESDSKDALIKADEQFKEWKEKEYKDIGIAEIKEMNVKSTYNNESGGDKIKTIVKNLENDAKDALIQLDEQIKEKESKNVRVESFKEMNTQTLNTENDSDVDIVQGLENNPKNAGNEPDERKYQQWKVDEYKKDVSIEQNINSNQQIDESLLKTTENISTKPRNIEFSQINKVKQVKKIETSTTSPVQITTFSPEFEAFQHFILSQFGSQENDPETAAEEATRLIQDSELRNKVFDNLANAESASTDLFENPDLFVNSFGEY